jgi:excisionase family DNA binding protein
VQRLTELLLDSTPNSTRRTPLELLTVQETAALLKLNPKTVRNYIATGRLAARRIGRRVRVERAAAEALAQPVLPNRPAHESSLDLATVTRLTPTEIAQQLAVLADAAILAGSIRARRAGELLPESWSFIRESREEPSHPRLACHLR